MILEKMTISKQICCEKLKSKLLENLETFLGRNFQIFFKKPKLVFFKYVSAKVLFKSSCSIATSSADMV